MAAGARNKSSQSAVPLPTTSPLAEPAPAGGRGGGRGDAEREHKQHPEQLGRLGDKRDRLDRLGRAGEARHGRGHEQRRVDAALKVTARARAPERLDVMFICSFPSLRLRSMTT